MTDLTSVKHDFPISRLIDKNGTCRIRHRNVKCRRRRYLMDIFTTLVDIKWRWILVLFALGFIGTWLIFGGVWYLICFVHDDFQHLDDESWQPCVQNVNDFTSILLFSMETQTTIGYGYRYITDACAEGIALVMIQSVIGAMLQALLTGLIFTKVQKPKKRAQTLMFSKNACIYQHAGILFLSVRVGDMRKSNMIDSHVRAICVMSKTSIEGKVIPYFRHELDFFVNEDNDNRIFLMWPVVITHKITSASPFWEINAKTLHDLTFELIVILEAVVEPTGMMVQARTSYLPSDVIWGHRFKPMTTMLHPSGYYQFDCKNFQETVVDPTTPDYSAKRHIVRQLSCPESFTVLEEEKSKNSNPSVHFKKYNTWGRFRYKSFR